MAVNRQWDWPTLCTVGKVHKQSIGGRGTPHDKNEERRRADREHLMPSEVRCVDRGRKEEPQRSSRRDRDPGRLPPRSVCVSEVCDLRRNQIDELRVLRRLQRESAASPFVFVSERGSPFTPAGFARMLERAARAASLEINARLHMLRRACGYKLANADLILAPFRLGLATGRSRRSPPACRRIGSRPSGVIEGRPSPVWRTPTAGEKEPSGMLQF